MDSSESLITIFDFFNTNINDFLNIGCIDTMSSQHLGGDVVPSTFLGCCSVRHWSITIYHINIISRLRDNDLIFIGYMHKWRSKRR